MSLLEWSHELFPLLKLCFHHAQHISEPSCEIVHINQWLKTSHWQCTFACLKHVSLLWCMISDASSVSASVFENSQHSIINYILFYSVYCFFFHLSSHSSQLAVLCTTYLKCKLICSMAGISVSMRRLFLAQQSSETCLVQVTRGQSPLLLSDFWNLTPAESCTIQNHFTTCCWGCL